MTLPAGIRAACKDGEIKILKAKDYRFDAQMILFIHKYYLDLKSVEGADKFWKIMPKARSYQKWRRRMGGICLQKRLRTARYKVCPNHRKKMKS
ncbi:MAG: hypothetical protein CML13_08410 [Puniceicoccaceae bacterium]|nr:hypothetical protein [Puniceicoccaceae bacterium]